MAERLALLIEDDPPTAAMVSEWLRDAGWRVIRAERGDEGFARFQEARPQAVVCELALAGMDGPTLCSHIRLSPFGERVTVVLVSARSEVRDAGVAAGADAFLAKPVAREDLLAALERPRPALVREESPAPAGPLRLPAAAVLGADEGTPDVEEGPLGPELFLPLLERLHERAFTGVLEAEGTDTSGADLRAKLFFHRGCPAAARSNDASTEFGRVLVRLGVVAPSVLEESVGEGRLRGLPLGEVLLRNRLLDRGAVERALREQVLLRAVGVGRLERGRYVVLAAEPLGLAGFDVPPVAIAWRLGGDATPPPPDTALDHFVHADVSPALWSLLDPDEALGVPRALISGGATVRDCVRLGGPRVGALLSLLRAHGHVRFAAEPPPLAAREAGLAELAVEDVAARLVDRHRALADANHYTVLGLDPSADTEDVALATVAALAEHDPDALPAALDAESRRRAREVFDRVLEAGRVLSDPDRRAVYDARLAGEAHVRVADIGHENHAVLQAERARDLFRRGDHVTAAALFHMAILLEGEDPDILAMLGWARHRACPEDPEAGEPQLRRALELDPEGEYASYYLGCLLAERGDKDEARRLLRAVVAHNHEFEDARDKLAEVDR